MKLLQLLAAIWSCVDRGPQQVPAIAAHFMNFMLTPMFEEPFDAMRHWAAVMMQWCVHEFHFLGFLVIHSTVVSTVCNTIG